MQAFTPLDAVAAPLFEPNIDTDKLIPHKFLRKPLAAGYRNFLFHDQRFAEDGSVRPDFVLNRAPFDRARVLVAGRNFGCGSTREGAIYALQDFGIRCVVAPSFGDIFYANCLQNGLLPVVLGEATVAALAAHLEAHPGAHVAVDLAAQTLALPQGGTVRFDIDAVRKEQLLKGLDDIGMTQQHAQAIARFETAYRARHPWLFRDLPGLPRHAPRAGEGS
ncbi:MAG: 3-isopropylmalate dehydratase small subunit [Burkholderiales bacterium]|nr:3-isopropylmalate dehydratase small subunit [Burkholderiales bacterium]